MYRTRATLLLSIMVATAFAAPFVVWGETSINWTFYAPGAGGRIEGGFEASRRDANGASAIHTLDDVRLGKSKYVTLASATSMYGRWYCIGTVQYVSPIDRMRHTLTDVVGYIHDTGCAFNGTCSCATLPKYCNGQAHPEKMDIAVGNFTGWGALTASAFVDRNNNSAPRSWQQIDGLPVPGQNNGTSCGGNPREDGTPTQAAYNPTSTYDPMPGTPQSNALMRGYQQNTAQQPYGSSSGYQQSSQQYGSSATNPYTNNTQTSAQSTTQTQSGQTRSNEPAALIILAQPSTVLKGDPVLLSWASVGMRTETPCRILINNTVAGQGNNGSQVLDSVSNASGTISFALQCVTAGGQSLQQTTSVTIK